MQRVTNMLSGIIKKNALLLLKIDWRLITFIFAISIISTGLLTVPRFNDGISHIRVAQLWYESGSMPSSFDGEPFRESFLWYFLVQALGHVVNGNIPLTAQIIQCFFYTGILILTYKITYIRTNSDLTAKCALIFAASTPMLNVTSILCFIDVICAFFVLLSIFFLMKKRFFSAILACVGVWYSKRTGVIELVPFFIVFSIYIYLHTGKNIKRSLISLCTFATIFLVIILPGVIRMYVCIGMDDAYARSFDPAKIQTPENVLITHSGLAAKGLPINDMLIWTGGVFACLAFFIIISLALGRYRRKIILFWEKNYTLPFIFIITIGIISSFSLGRLTIRYWSIVIAVGVISLTASLMKTPLKGLIIILTFVALIQQSLILAYVYKKRRNSASDTQVLRVLKNIPEDRKIIWNETRYGTFYLKRKIFWHDKLSFLLSQKNKKKMHFDNIGAIVVTKRFLYQYKGKFYDRGIPFFLYEKYKKCRQMQLALDNNDYSVFILTGDKSVNHAP